MKIAFSILIAIIYIVAVSTNYLPKWVEWVVYGVMVFDLIISIFSYLKKERELVAMRVYDFITNNTFVISVILALASTFILGITIANIFK